MVGDALADSRQLLPAQHVHDAVAADSALQDHRAAWLCVYVSDPD
jgi:hypothetical protein